MVKVGCSSVKVFQFIIKSKVLQFPFMFSKTQSTPKFFFFWQNFKLDFRF
jgi:hypothetical protein